MFSAQSTNGDGTINPLDLSASGASHTVPNTVANPSPRGIKRSRSPETYSGDLQPGDGLGDDGDAKGARKRGRPMKRAIGVPESPIQPTMTLSQIPPQTPQSASHPLGGMTPTQASPPKATPTKTVIKALPTVRDHTTDQLGPEGDEYIPREYDESGEKKVSNTGHLLEGREYRCRTFFVPNRGDKLFMLATECARVLGYRDSYLLFNKNRSLYKIIATQAEKEDLIHQEILPFSYRSRQIAIVTAKSMFRQFGSRVITHGRRVRDDYWEAKARKQGFTEEDLAGEKRPGAAKARDQAAAEASASAASLAMGHHGDIVYNNAPTHYAANPQPQTVQPGMIAGPGSVPQLPMITLAPEIPDMRIRDYSNIQRPRQEITGPAYQDRTQQSHPNDLLSHAHQTADYNKQINLQRGRSSEYLDTRWRRTHEAPPPVVSQPGANDNLPTQPTQSPRTSQSNLQQPNIAQQSPQHMLQGSYSQPPHVQSTSAQTPMRSMPPQNMRADQMGRSPAMLPGASHLSQTNNPYAFAPQNQMWPPSQPQQSPQHFTGYASQQSPQLSQSPHHPPPQLRHQGSSSQMQQQPPLQYPGMQGLGQQGYPNPGRGMYSSDPASQQFMQPSTSGPQASNQSWAQQQSPTGANWGWNGQPQ